MVKNFIFNCLNFGVLFVILGLLTIGCAKLDIKTLEEAESQITVRTATEPLPTFTGTPTPQDLPSTTPDLPDLDTLQEGSFEEASRVDGASSEPPRPSPTPTLNSQQLCQPFPESLVYLGSTEILGYPAWTLRGRCQGEVTFFRSPVGNMRLFDYTSLTGRFVYGSPNSMVEGLWVYDYWTELSEKWSDDAILQAEWAQVRNTQDIHQMGILNIEGTLFVASGPFEMRTVSTGVSSFSIEPNGKRLAFVKNHVLYIVGMDGGQPRKLAEDVAGKPLWARDANAIIFPSSPIKIAQLDGSGSFTPQQNPSVLARVEYLCEGKLNCSFPTKQSIDHLLWSEARNRLVFYPSPSSGDGSLRHIFVYELSEDLQRIINFQRILGEYAGQLTWDVYGESLVDSAGNEIEIGLSSEFFIEQARINYISGYEFGVEFATVDPEFTSYFGHHFSQVVLSDQVVILDKEGHVISLDSLTTGMTIKLKGRRLDPYTLSLFAYTIQVYCDQIPCYLGFEGRS
jgi:hypothetical protein